MQQHFQIWDPTREPFGNNSGVMFVARWLSFGICSTIVWAPFGCLWAHVAPLWHLSGTLLAPCGHLLRFFVFVGSLVQFWHDFESILDTFWFHFEAGGCFGIY